MWIEGASNFAPMVDLHMLIINVATILACVLLNAVLVYFIIRYRRRSDKDITSNLAHNTLFEVLWTVIPTIIMFAMFVMGLIGFKQMRASVPGAREVTVVAQQWSWDFYYPATLRTNKAKTNPLKSPTNEVYVEEGVPVKFIMKSKDVLHSFFVPAFRVKEDVVPNMYTFIALVPQISKEQASKGEGHYEIFCAEYCGKDHSYMQGKVHILKADAFRKKMEELEAEESNVKPENGLKTFQANCKSCHTSDGSKLVGPSFKGLWGKTETLETGTVLVDENYIQKSILQPGADIVKGYGNLMPPQNLSDAEIASMIEYLKTLK